MVIIPIKLADTYRLDDYIATMQVVKKGFLEAIE